MIDLFRKKRFSLDEFPVEHDIESRVYVRDMGGAIQSLLTMGALLNDKNEEKMNQMLGLAELCAPLQRPEQTIGHFPYDYDIF